MTRRVVSLHTLCYLALFFVLFFLTYTDVLTLKIANAAPFPFVALVVCIAFFYDIKAAFFAGLICGIFCDAVSAQPSPFNAICLALIGCAAALLISFYLNRNILSLLVLSAGGCAVYFFAVWTISFFSHLGADSMEHFLFFILPSAIYSAVLVFPIYFVGKLINRIQ